MAQMLGRALAFKNAMSAVGIGHELKNLVIIYQLIQQHFCITIMYVIIPHTINIKQLPT
jgi:hypothetical protein